MSFENYTNPLFENDIPEAYEVLARYNRELMRGVVVDHQRRMPADDALAVVLDTPEEMRTEEEVAAATDELVREAEIETALDGRSNIFHRIGVRATNTLEVTTAVAETKFPVGLELVNPVKFSQYILCGEPVDILAKHTKEIIITTVLQTLHDRLAIYNELIEQTHDDYEVFEQLQQLRLEQEIVFEHIETWLSGEMVESLPILRELRQTIGNPAI